MLVYLISGRVFDFMSSFLSNRPLRVNLNGKSSQKCPVNAGIPKSPFLVLHFTAC